MCTCRNACKHIQHSGIHFSGIGLAGYRIAGLESHLLGNHRVNLVDRLLIPVKEFQEACLCTCRSLTSQKLQGTLHIFQIFQIHGKLLHPKSGTFSHGCRLCRLEMGKCQSRLCLIFFCELCQLCNHIYQFFLHKLQGFIHHDNIGIITYITACGSQMDDSLCFRTLYTVSIHMGHNIMTALLLTGFCHVIIDVLLKLFQFINLFLGNRQSQFFLCLCQSYP